MRVKDMNKRNALACAAFITLCLCLAGCRPPWPKSREGYIDSGAVVSLHSKTYNVEKLDSFFDGAPPEISALTVIIYTVEGDPIIHEISYANKSYRIKIDNGYDRYGDGVLRELEFSHAQKLISDGKTIYLFSNGSVDPADFQNTVDSFTLLSIAR